MDERDLARTKVCACDSVRSAARAITQRYDQILAPSGLRATQFSLLARLVNLGPLTLGELAAPLVMDRTTLTRNIALLEREGWVRVETGTDRRTRLVSVTDEGRAMALRALPLWDEAQAYVTGAFGLDRLKALRKELGTFTKTLR